MSQFSKMKSILLAGAALSLAACTQGNDIESPGPTNPGPPPSGGGGGGGGGGGTADACPSGLNEGTAVGGQTVCEVSGTILTNLTLPFKDDDSDGVGVAYRINGRVDVGVDRGADGTGGTPGSLTIEPGVTVFGASGSDYLVVNRGSQIIADGTANAPIIFTSEDDLAGTQADPENANSEWGGLVILGRAPINRCIVGMPATVQCQNNIEGVTNPEAQYGGATADDNSGVLRYVQVRFAGFPLSSGNELNGISFGGVGSGTTVDYVQVHNNSDDGIEMFGGTANLKHIVLTGNDDESLDTDNGWTGNVQYMIIKQRAGGGDNGMEMSSVDPMTAPATNPTIANFTLIGTQSRAIRLNTGHIGRFLNGVVVHPDQCFRWEDAGDGDNTDYDGVGVDPSFDSVLFDCPDLTNEDPETPAVGATLAAGSNNLTRTGDGYMNQLSMMFFPGMAEQNATAFDLTTLGGSFFEDANYVGAFSPNETPTNNWATGWTFALFPDPACPTGTTETGSKNGLKVCSVFGAKTDPLTLTRGNIYELDGRVDIGLDAGADLSGGDPASLTIEAGVTIFGNSGSDYLVVNRGSQIFSNGTRQNPVIFTSEGDLDNPGRNDEDTNAEWGGLVVLGAAPINRCISGMPATVQCQNNIEGVTNPEAQYGGATANDDSGSILYTQVKFAGFPLSSGNELNGISFGGVGSGTTVDYVQVHNNSDDGIEMFGGTANLKHIVLTGNDDESLDTDNGWTGNVQYMIIKQRLNGGDNGMEMSSVDPSTTPATNPTIANFTLFGTQSRAIRLNTGHIGRFLNGVVVHSDQCFRWEDAGDGDSTDYDGLGIDPTFNSVVFDCPDLTNEDPETQAAVDAVAADANNDASFSNTLINMFINGPSEDAATPFATPLSSIDGFFEDTDYVGAVEDANDDWWAEWSCGLDSTDC